MKTRIIFLSCLAIFVSHFYACSEGQTDTGKVAPDTTAQQPKFVDTTGYVGLWKCSYSRYAYIYHVELSIEAEPTEWGTKYVCIWTEREELEGNRKTFSWNMQCNEEGALFGRGKLHRDNTRMILYKDTQQATTLHTKIYLGGNGIPWELTFTRS